MGGNVGPGDRYPCIDYTDQALDIGSLYFLRIDVGYETTSGKHRRE